MIWAVPLLCVKLIPHALTPVMYRRVFGVWLDLELRLTALLYPVLYHPTLNYKANPKAISGRTSYYQVRLAFHP